MTGRDDGPGGRSGNFLASMAIGAVVGFAVVMGIRAFVSEAPPAKTVWTAELVDRDLRAQVYVGELYRTVKQVYPAEYQAYLRPMTEAYRSGSRRTKVLTEARFLRRLLFAHAEGIARAPAAQLTEIMRHYAQMVETMQRIDPAFCAQVMTASLPLTAERPREAMIVMNRIAVLEIRAAQAGEARPGTTRRREPTSRDWAAVRRETDRRAPGASRLLTDPARRRGAMPAALCSAWRAYYEAVASLPPAAAGRVSAHLLRQSYRAGAARRD